MPRAIRVSHQGRTTQDQGNDNHQRDLALSPEPFLLARGQARTGFTFAAVRAGFFHYAGEKVVDQLIAGNFAAEGTEQALIHQIAQTGSSQIGITETLGAPVTRGAGDFAAPFKDPEDTLFVLRETCAAVTD